MWPGQYTDGLWQDVPEGRGMNREGAVAPAVVLCPDRFIDIVDLGFKGQVGVKGNPKVLNVQGWGQGGIIK